MSNIHFELFKFMNEHGDKTQDVRKSVMPDREIKERIVKMRYGMEIGYGQEIIRCKDCKYCVKEPNGELYCDILAVGYEPLGSKKVNGDWFCADGERQEGR